MASDSKICISPPPFAKRVYRHALTLSVTNSCWGNGSNLPFRPPPNDVQKIVAWDRVALYAIHVFGTFPPLAASWRMTSLWSQTFIFDEPFMFPE